MLEIQQEYECENCGSIYFKIGLLDKSRMEMFVQCKECGELRECLKWEILNSRIVIITEVANVGLATMNLIAMCVVPYVRTIALILATLQ